MVPFANFLCGCREEDDATACSNYLIGRGYSTRLKVNTLEDGPWGPSDLSFLSQGASDSNNIEWTLDEGFYNDDLPCSVVLIHAWGGLGERSEEQGIIGIVPDVICTARDIDLAPGDTITLPGGEQFEFREHTLYWDEYNEHFLLWRMN